MRPGETIGKCFIEDLLIDRDSSFSISFTQSGLSYSDGTNTYHLGGNGANTPLFEYPFKIITPKVNFVFIYLMCIVDYY